MILAHPIRTNDLGWQRLLFKTAVVLALLLIGLNSLLVVRSALFDDILNPRIVGQRQPTSTPWSTGSTI